MRTLAIGDIHGCFDSLVSLESLVPLTEKDRVITLGDYVDRGPDSQSVINWLVPRVDAGWVKPLMGNHELMMLSARDSLTHREQWLGCGGEQTLASYQCDSLDGVPSTHWSLLKRCRSYVETSTHFFVHANAYPDLPIDDQPDYMLYWESFNDQGPHESGKTMVCGHTPQRSGYPLNVGHAVCIDTAACKGGWLTCLDVGSGRCWQANQSGETRSFFLDDIE